MAANNHYGGYGPGTVDLVRHSMDMEKISYENVDIQKLNHQMELENRFNYTTSKLTRKGKQTSISDFIKQ